MFEPKDSCFTCPCLDCLQSSRLGITKELCDLLNKMQIELDLPMVITSGRRCFAHNASIPGASPRSRHLIGEAVDIATSGDPSLAREIVNAAFIYLAPCVEVCPLHIHVDVRKVAQPILIMGKSG